MQHEHRICSTWATPQLFCSSIALTLQTSRSCCALYCCMHWYLSTVPLPCMFKADGAYWIVETVCDGLQNFSAVDRLLWAARINVDRVDFSFTGDGTALPLSQDADWVQVTTVLKPAIQKLPCKQLADPTPTCLSCTDTCSLKLALIALLHTCMAVS